MKGMIYKNGAKEYAATYIRFGGLMGLIIGIARASVLYGIIGGAIAGGLFTLLMFVFIACTEKKFDAMRREIAGERTIYCDGGATLSGNGGWMFFTENGLEFYPHKANLSTAKIRIPLETIVSVCDQNNKLIVTTKANGDYTVLVAKANLWAQKIKERL